VTFPTRRGLKGSHDDARFSLPGSISRLAQVSGRRRTAAGRAARARRRLGRCSARCRERPQLPVQVARLDPDGLEDLGFVDDAFVLRVAAALVPDGERDAAGVLGKLAADATLIGEFLGTDYARLERYVQKLGDGSVRGRSVAQILDDAAIRSDFVRESCNGPPATRRPPSRATPAAS